MNEEDETNDFDSSKMSAADNEKADSMKVEFPET